MNACTNITVHSGASCLLAIKELKGSKRRYILDHVVVYDVEFDRGTLRVQTEPGFILEHQPHLLIRIILSVDIIF